MNAHAFSDVGKCAVFVVMKNDDAAPIVGGFEAFWKESICSWMKKIRRLEVAAYEQIHCTVVVIIEGDGLDRIHVSIQAGDLRHVAKFTVSQILIQDAAPKTQYQKVRQPIVVEVKPQCPDRSVVVVIALCDSGGFRNISESEVAVVVVEVV